MSRPGPPGLSSSFIRKLDASDTAKFQKLGKAPMETLELKMSPSDTARCPGPHQVTASSGATGHGTNKGLLTTSLFKTPGSKRTARTTSSLWTQRKSVCSWWRPLASGGA